MQQDELYWRKHQSLTREAIKALYDRYFKACCIYVGSLLPNHDMEVVKDIVQNVFIQFLEQSKRSQIDNIKGYLFSACKFSALKYQSREARRKELVQWYHSGYEAVVFPHSDMILYQLSRLLLKMPQRRREAFQRVYIYDQKHAEAAREMGIRIDTLKEHLRLSLMFLRNALKLIVIVYFFYM